MRGITSITLLFEVARLIVSNEKSLTLPAECVEYLKALEAQDVYGGGGLIDEHLHNLICRHRRLRIENDVKVSISNLIY